MDSSPAAIFHSDTGTKQEQWSEEVFYQLTAKRFDLLLGGYVFGQRQGYDEDRNLIGFCQPRNFGGGRQRHSVQVLYGNIDFRVDDALTLSGGLRASRGKIRPRLPMFARAPHARLSPGRVPLLASVFLARTMASKTSVPGPRYRRGLGLPIRRAPVRTSISTGSVANDQAGIT
jgi:hypothetical protein